MVINHLVTSQLVYTAVAVPVPHTIIKQVNKLVFNFLWNSKKEKVKRNTCYNPVIEGGLGMIDLDSKCRSLRLSWIQKYFKGEQSAWKISFKYWTQKIGEIPLCFKFNCKKNDMYHICKRKKLPEFYVDLFCTWSELKYVDLLYVNNIENEIIWYNSNVKFRNELLYFPSWINNGVLKVKQVIKDRVWKEIEQVCNDFLGRILLSSFKFAKLKSAFPVVWLRKLRNRQQCSNVLQPVDPNIKLATGDVINAEGIKAKGFYDLFLKKNKREPSFPRFWQAYFKLPNTFVWEVVLKHKFNLINDNRIKQFNFKLLHKILPCKDNLFKWKITNDNLCNSCRIPETSFHFLLSCKKITAYWKIHGFTDHG